MFKVYEKDYVVEIVLDSPPKNLFNIDDLKYIESRIESVGSDKAFIIVYGDSNVFSYGFDYNSFLELSGEDIESHINYLKRVFNKLRLFDGYVIAAIKGVALDEGFELALMSDYIVAEPGSKLGFSRDRIKYFFSLGGLNRIMERGGEYLFNKILFEGGILSSEYAYELRLIDFIDEDPVWYARNLSSLMIDEYGVDGVYNLKNILKEKYVHYNSLISSIEDRIIDIFPLKYDLKEVFSRINHSL